MAKDEVLRLRIDKRLLDQVRRTAKREGADVSSFIRDLINQRLSQVQDSAAESPAETMARAWTLMGRAMELWDRVGGTKYADKVFEDIKKWREEHV